MFKGWNPTLWKARSHVSCLFNAMTADGLVSQGARASAAMVLTGITWWHHQMETFSALLALCAGNSPVPVNSPHKGQWRGALMFSLICAWINDWVNNYEAGHLRRHRHRHRGHYEVNVMAWKIPLSAPEGLLFNDISIVFHILYRHWPFIGPFYYRLHLAFGWAISSYCATCKVLMLVTKYCHWK